jgi:predicted PhzF superfamily epimerase YddE/YHI9
VIPLYWVDAFAEHAFGGNPAAVCLLGEPADERWMQALAAELGIAETAFTWPEGAARRLRWFTPVTEVDLCGHATLAAAHALREAGRATDGETVAFLTRAGALTARLDGPLVELDLPADPPSPVPVPHGPGLGAPAVAAARGARYLVAEVATAAELRGLRPDLGAVARMDDVAVVVTAAGDRPGVDYVLRVFAPRVGIDEDPVTGSAQCALGPYWAARLGRATMAVEQASPRGGRLRVSVRGDRVLVAGGATTVLSGVTPPP